MIHVLEPVRDQDERIGVGCDDIRFGPETYEFEGSEHSADFDFFFDGHERVGHLRSRFPSLENGQRD